MNDYLPIEDYGLIGNLHTTALVSKTGSIDFLPFTRFDSPTIFAALLDRQKGGHWQISPNGEPYDSKQMYLPETGILLTRFYTRGGIAELTDFLPIKQKEKRFSLVRTLKIIKGELRIKMECLPRFDYARSLPIMEQQPDSIHVQCVDKKGLRFRLLSNRELQLQHHSITGEWVLQQGELLSFVLESRTKKARLYEKEELDAYTQRAFLETVHYWRNWVEQSTYTGRWREMVLRSAITLKMLTSYTYGSTVAAATFGLPEYVGYSRNWDYRFTWIRDSAFTMYAFLSLGFTQEARQYIRWVMDRIEHMADASELQLMYAVDGACKLEEVELDHLEGYKGSRPVRVGNAAYKQFQLDIYGELIDTIYLYNMHGGPITYEFWKYVAMLIDHVTTIWQTDDHGIWEVRNEERDFLSSKVMAWVALERGIQIADYRSFPAPLDKWRKVRDEIYLHIYTEYWNEEVQAFVQYKGASLVDASALLMPLMRMFSPAEPRWVATLAAIERELVTDSLVYRYSLENGASDGLDGPEGTFSICSFWYIECLSKAGRVEEARLLFEKLLSYANHLGLYSEQIGLQGQQLGNFPQAFTHLSLISAALQLNRDLSAKPGDYTTNDQYV
ncbi:glycoside hydrolase family 15 protein [Cesiribacter andamanensis]|nr:glycoside hydrolase family 15 protein [Cesiribacter andamanensis]